MGGGGSANIFRRYFASFHTISDTNLANSCNDGTAMNKAITITAKGFTGGLKA